MRASVGKIATCRPPGHGLFGPLLVERYLALQQAKASPVMPAVPGMPRGSGTTAGRTFMEAPLNPGRRPSRGTYQMAHLEPSPNFRVYLTFGHLT